MEAMLAKTSRPHFSGVYQRSHLFDLLDLARQQYTATLVNGPPGAGKTTLVSSYIEFRELQCLWYQMDGGDEDVAAFFHYFMQAASKYSLAPALGVAEFDTAAGADLVGFSRQYFRKFYSTLKAPLLLVLDNYQELSCNSKVHDVVRIACAEIPQGCHIVIAGRDICPKPFGEIRFNRALATIGADDLGLTLNETAGIAELQGVKLHSAAAIQALQARSGGWMMGLMLILKRIGTRTNGTRTDVSLQYEQEEHIFEYFGEEVFRKFDPPCRDLLLKSALFPRMTLHRVTQLTGTAKAGELLRELVGKNDFVTYCGGKEGAYLFHPLFRKFLLSQGVVRYVGTDLASHYCKAAEVLIADGDHEAALDLLEQARSWNRMAEVILTAAPALRAQGRVATLETWMKKLPASLVGNNAWLLYWNGSIHAYSDPLACQATLEDAYRRFMMMDNFLGTAMSWSGLVNTIFRVHKDLRQMDVLVAEFKKRLGERFAQLPPDLNIRVTLAFFIALFLRQPHHPELPFWLKRLRALLDAGIHTRKRPLFRQHLVSYHILRGEHAEAESILSMLHYADNLPAAERPPRTQVDYVNEALVALHVGMGKRCLRAVSEGLRMSERSGNRFSDATLLQLGAAMSLNREQMAQADEYLATFERLAESMPALDCGPYYALAAWRRFHAREPMLALQLMSRAVAASETRGIPYYVAADNLGLGLLLHLCGKNNEALLHLKVGRRMGACIQNPLIEYVYHIFSAYVSLSLSGENKAVYHLVNGMRLGREHGYMHFIFFPPRVISRLCFLALEAGIEIAYVQMLIERNELMPDPAWGQAESWPWPLRIYTLGRFGVVKNGVALRFSGKAQKKPLELLKALIAFGGRDVSEAKLADTLWPEAEGDAAAQALATTLFRLRKLIGEHVIRRQENRLTLDSALCWVDCWAFERLSTENSGTPIALAKLRKLYQGLFLDGADDAPWAHPLRERLHARYSRLSRLCSSNRVGRRSTD